jgi:uncharacterized protein with ParB-like and HNH nuclease domain
MNARRITMQMSIRKVVKSLNENEENGGFWLPNIQRPFVWREEQIEKLFDSVMRDYPISTLLAWRTKSNMKQRRFIKDYKKGINLYEQYEGNNNKAKYLVLDGQQRLQSFYIGLKGTYEKKKLCFNILSGKPSMPEETMYKFKFLESDKIKAPWFSVNELVMDNSTNKVIKKKCANEFEDDLTIEQIDLIEDNIDKIRNNFVQQEKINIQIIDSVDNPELYSEDDIVEIFIRYNSGGTVLGKSDLLFSLLTVSWEDANENISELLYKLNAQGFKFDRDFILKTCLSLLKKGAAYNVTKFREPTTKEEIQKKWDKIYDAICAVKDFLYDRTYIRTDKALSSYLMLIPLIYFRYHYKDRFNNAIGMDTYILRSLLSGVFGGSPDSMIDNLTKQIDEDKDFVLNNIFGEIRKSGRNLEISEELLLQENYYSKNIHLLFNLWYKDFNYIPSFQNNFPQVDHIFPQSLLKSVKIINPNTGKRDVLKYKWFDRDQIGNLMLLTKEENGPSGKSDIPPVEWFKDKSEDYLDKHLIPKDKELWKLENYEKFIEERKKLILNKFADIIMK